MKAGVGCQVSTVDCGGSTDDSTVVDGGVTTGQIGKAGDIGHADDGSARLCQVGDRSAGEVGGACRRDREVAENGVGGEVSGGDVGEACDVGQSTGQICRSAG